MGREGRDYWEAQLSEYWDRGLTIQEYSELKEHSCESTRLDPSVAKGTSGWSERLGSAGVVEVNPLQTKARDGLGIRLVVDGIEIALAKGFDGPTLSEVLDLLKVRSCSGSAAR